MSNDVKPTAKVAKEIEARVKSGKCILCDESHTHRGLCPRHYQMYLRRIREAQDAGKFESDAIRAGKILPVNKVRELNRVDPFAEISQ